MAAPASMVGSKERRGAWVPTGQRVECRVQKSGCGAEGVHCPCPPVPGCSGHRCHGHRLFLPAGHSVQETPWGLFSGGWAGGFPPWPGLSPSLWQVAPSFHPGELERDRSGSEQPPSFTPRCYVAGRPASPGGPSPADTLTCPGRHSGSEAAAL